MKTKQWREAYILIEEETTQMEKKIKIIEKEKILNTAINTKKIYWKKKKT